MSNYLLIFDAFSQRMLHFARILAAAGHLAPATSLSELEPELEELITRIQSAARVADKGLLAVFRKLLAAGQENQETDSEEDEGDEGEVEEEEEEEKKGEAKAKRGSETGSGLDEEGSASTSEDWDFDLSPEPWVQANSLLLSSSCPAFNEEKKLSSKHTSQLNRSNAFSAPYFDESDSDRTLRREQRMAIRLKEGRVRRYNGDFSFVPDWVVFSKAKRLPKQKTLFELCLSSSLLLEMCPFMGPIERLDAIHSFLLRGIPLDSLCALVASYLGDDMRN